MCGNFLQACLGETNQNFIAFTKKLRAFWSQGRLLPYGPESVSARLLIKNMPVIISRIMRCLELWYYLGREKVRMFLMGNPESNGPHTRNTFKQILNTLNGRSWIALIWLRTGTRCSCFEHGCEPSGRARVGKYYGVLQN